MERYRYEEEIVRKYAVGSQTKCARNMISVKVVRGKFVDRLAAGASVVVLDPDVAKVFPTSESVNDALRALASIIRSVPTRRRGGKKSA